MGEFLGVHLPFVIFENRGSRLKKQSLQYWYHGEQSYL